MSVPILFKRSNTNSGHTEQCWVLNSTFAANSQHIMSPAAPSLLSPSQPDIQQTNSAKFLILREILDSNRREYKHKDVLRCYAVQSGMCITKVFRNLLLPFSGCPKCTTSHTAGPKNNTNKLQQAAPLSRSCIPSSGLRVERASVDQVDAWPWWTRR